MSSRLWRRILGPVWNGSNVVHQRAIRVESVSQALETYSWHSGERAGEGWRLKSTVSRGRKGGKVTGGKGEGGRIYGSGLRTEPRGHLCLTGEMWKNINGSEGLGKRKSGWGRRGGESGDGSRVASKTAKGPSSRMMSSGG